MSRDIRLEIRVKNARLLDSIEARWGKIIDQVWEAKPGNHKSARPVVREAASLAQVSYNAMASLLRMAIPAYNRRSGKPIPSAQAIADALDETVEYLFPPGLCSKNIPVVIEHISATTFLSLTDVPAAAAIVPSPDDDELSSPTALQKVESLLSCLSRIEKAVVIGRFGLDGEPKTCEEIGHDWALSRERIRQIESKAFRKLRSKMAPEAAARFEHLKELKKLVKPRQSPKEQRSVPAVPSQEKREEPDVISPQTAQAMFDDHLRNLADQFTAAAPLGLPSPKSG